MREGLTCLWGAEMNLRGWVLVLAVPLTNTETLNPASGSHL